MISKDIKRECKKIIDDMPFDKDLFQLEIKQKGKPIYITAVIVRKQIAVDQCLHLVDKYLKDEKLTGKFTIIIEDEHDHIISKTKVER